MRFFAPLTTSSRGGWGSHVPGIPTPAPSAFGLSQPLNGLLLRTTCLSCFIQAPSMGFKELGGEFQNHSRLRRLPGASAVSYRNGPVELNIHLRGCLCRSLDHAMSNKPLRVGIDDSTMLHATHQSDSTSDSDREEGCADRHVRLQP